MKKEDKTKLSVVVIAKNEEANIEECLESLQEMADEIILVDTGSKDNTVTIAKKYKAKIVQLEGGTFSKWRNEGLKKAVGNWIFYIDADERVTPLLRKEINKLTNEPVSQFSAYAIPRRNFILGKEMKYGGWFPDYVKRLYKKNSLQKWKGDLHEEPVFEGEMGHLEHPLIHKKHDSLADMVEKTNNWSNIEARLLYEDSHPKMAWWRFISIMLSEFYLRVVKLKGYKDGPEGIIYAFYQVWSRFMTYAKLWEMQLKSSKLEK